jgi:hypothetical protein
VAIELGYALHARTENNVLLVFNSHYGAREDLPFDLRHKGGAIVFNLPPSAGREEIEAQGKVLKDQFTQKLKPFLTSKPGKQSHDKQALSLKANINHYLERCFGEARVRSSSPRLGDTSSGY